MNGSAPSAHGVQLYRDTGELADSVAAYLAAGFDAGELRSSSQRRSTGTSFAERLGETVWGAKTRCARAETVLFTGRS